MVSATLVGLNVEGRPVAGPPLSLVSSERVPVNRRSRPRRLSGNDPETSRRSRKWGRQFLRSIIVDHVPRWRTRAFEFF